MDAVTLLFHISAHACLIGTPLLFSIATNYNAVKKPVQLIRYFLFEGTIPLRAYSMETQSMREEYKSYRKITSTVYHHRSECTYLSLYRLVEKYLIIVKSWKFCGF